MPDGITTLLGGRYVQDFWLREPIAGLVDWEFFLFVNDYTPIMNSVLGDLVEPSMIGYHRVTVVRSTWEISGTADKYCW